MKMFGAGEEMPWELEDVLPGYEAWPSGFTIGPVDSLKALSPIRRRHYLRERLPQFQQLGWMTGEAAAWYRRHLRTASLASLKARAGRDLTTGQITSEVVAQIDALPD